MAGRSSDQKERYDGERSSAGADSDLNAAEETSDVMTFPEGGARAWSVAIGAAGVMFCTFGYVNAFGQVHISFRSDIRSF